MELLAFEATIIGLVFLARWLDKRINNGIALSKRNHRTTKGNGILA